MKQFLLIFTIIFSYILSVHSASDDEKDDKDKAEIRELKLDACKAILLDRLTKDHVNICITKKLKLEQILQTITPDKERNEKTDKFMSVLMLSCVKKITPNIARHVFNNFHMPIDEEIRL